MYLIQYGKSTDWDELMQGCGIAMPDLSNLSHFPEDNLQISIYLSWDKDIIALAGLHSSSYIEYPDYDIYFFLFLKENICCGYSLQVPHQVLLISTHNICFLQEIRKNNNFLASIFWLDKWILTIYLSMDK